MLLSAVSLACLLIAHVAGQCTEPPGTIPPNNDESNYVIDLFAGALLFTFAIDKCTATHILGAPMIKYECVNNNGKWSVTKTKFSGSDKTCTGTGTLDETFNEGATKGHLGYFVCDAKSSYVAVEVSIDSKCKDSQVVYAGLGGCTANDPLLTRFYCDETRALVEFFAAIIPSPSSTSLETSTYLEDSTTSMEDSTTSMEDSTTSMESSTTSVAEMALAQGSTSLESSTTYMESSTTYMESSTTDLQTSTTSYKYEAICNDNFYCTKWTFETSCKFVDELLGQQVYGKMSACVIEDDSSSSVDNSASSVFVITNLILAFVVSLFSLF